MLFMVTRPWRCFLLEGAGGMMAIELIMLAEPLRELMENMSGTNEAG